MFFSLTFFFFWFKSIQAPLLAKYPANLSVTAYSYFFGTVFMVATAVTMNTESINWTLTSSEVWAVIYAVRFFAFAIVLNETYYIYKYMSFLLYQLNWYSQDKCSITQALCNIIIVVGPTFGTTSFKTWTMSFVTPNHLLRNMWKTWISSRRLIVIYTSCCTKFFKYGYRNYIFTIIILSMFKKILILIFFCKVGVGGCRH